MAEDTLSRVAVPCVLLFLALESLFIACVIASFVMIGSLSAAM